MRRTPRRRRLWSSGQQTDTSRTSAEEAQCADPLRIAHRSEQQQQQQHHQQVLQPHGGPPSLQAGPSSSTINNSSFNFGASNGSGPPRRTSSGMQPGIAGMGAMGGGMRAPGKSGLTFEHILKRLQGELQNSRETGTELQSLNGTMSEVHDTLGGLYAILLG
ncbi:hypothetical protein EYR40_006080 [Pleurotus pulmonarius]|nr:hypothetical protein EYR40_006080 [Pleurotus pulmonarius]